MATRRRTTTTRRRSTRKKKIPPWALVLAGLTVGLTVAWGVHLFLARTDARNAPLTRAAAPAARPVVEPKRATARQPQQRFDFYTILPEIETVVPERERKTVPGKPAAATGKGSGRYVLQAASYGNVDDAEHLRATLALNGLEAQIEKVTIPDKGDFYRVRLGPYKSVEHTDGPRERLSQIGIKPLLLKLKKNPER